MLDSVFSAIGDLFRALIAFAIAGGLLELAYGFDAPEQLGDAQAAFLLVVAALVYLSLTAVWRGAGDG